MRFTLLYWAAACAAALSLTFWSAFKAFQALLETLMKMPSTRWLVSVSCLVTS